MLFTADVTGTLYSVNPKTRTEDLGTRDPETHTLYVYVHSTCASSRSTGIQAFPVE